MVSAYVGMATPCNKLMPLSAEIGFERPPQHLLSLFAWQQVREMYLRLPGGPSEAARVAALRKRAAAVAAQAEALTSSVVERPLPSQYGAIVEAMSAFTASTGSSARVHAVMDGLQVQSSAANRCLLISLMRVIRASCMIIGKLCADLIA